MQTLNNALRKEYNNLPVIVKYCGEYIDMKDLSTSSSTEVSTVPNELGCGKYNTTAKMILRIYVSKIQKKVADIQQRIKQGGFDSVNDALDYYFSEVQKFVDSNVMLAQTSRQRLMKQKVITEARDFQTAMTYFSWKALSITFPYIQQQVQYELANEVDDTDYSIDPTTSTTDPTSTADGQPTCRVGQYQPYTFGKYYEDLGRTIPTNNKIKRYAIQWSNGVWQEYTVGNDDDPAVPTLRRAWAYFTDHNFKILECSR